ncbi:Peroxisome biosynthesis protein pex1 [Mactra antiquata]
MSCDIVKVRFTQEKSCFVSLSQDVCSSNLSGATQDVQTFQLDERAYVSWSGDVVRNAKNVLQINGWFGAKLGLIDNTEVIIRRIQPVPICEKCSVEPLSCDDWEILDRHSSYVESHLLDIVRVIQKDAVYPIWVEKSVCVFIKIGATVPQTDCVLLVNETAVEVLPKVRSSVIGQPVVNETVTKSVTNDLNTPFIQSSDPYDEDIFDTKFRSVDSTDSVLKDFIPMNRDDRKVREKSPYDIASQWKNLFSYLGFRRPSIESRVNVSDNEDEDDYFDDSSIDQPELTLQSGLNLVLRVQSLKYNLSNSDLEANGYSQPQRRGSDSPRKGGSSSPRKYNRESPSRSNRSHSLPKSSFKMNYFPQQPSTVYMDMSDVEKQFKLNRCDIPHSFFAKIRKLLSPQQQHNQQQQQIKSSNGANKTPQRKPDSSTDLEKITPPGERPESSTMGISNPNSNDDPFCIVRVIVIDRRRQLCNDRYTSIIQRVLEEQTMLKGHVILPDMLRRFLKLDVTSRVWIQTFKGASASPTSFNLYPLGNIPKALFSDSSKINLAFREWLNQICVEEYPLVVHQGIFLRFPVYQGTYVEAQMTYKESTQNSTRSTYTLLHPGVLRNTNLTVTFGGRSSTDCMSHVIQSMLAYTNISSIDPPESNAKLESIGGMNDMLNKCLSIIEICLGSRRLYKEIFLTTPGLLNGMLLLTGPKGSGKTTLAKALCKKVMELPNLAYVHPVDCKPLRGKKVDTIQKTFELLFDEAAWRQPSLIFLDDLDHLCGAPAGPEFEMTGEALYAARVAEVLKDLLRKDIRNMTNICVMSTCQSRSSLHPILVSSRGTHLVQEVINIKPLNKAQRTDILEKIMKTKSMVTEKALTNLDLDQLSQRTEGYVARDLENIISRAVHAHILAQGRAIQDDIALDVTQEDFEVALNGFTPASIRNVPLHQAGELGWSDIGGLSDVKQTLIETLQWPTKYPALFADCPLRLRSGLMLYGAPGTGKTLLAGVVAKECGLNFISIKGPELLSKYIGASEQAVRDTFLRAQSAKPCILFFDEFDSIAPRRGHDNTGVTDRVVNQLLTQLDGVEGLDGVYVLAATSRPDLIDPALLRPGRLDKCLLCKLPDQEERLHILKALSNRMSLSSEVNLEYFAKTCEDFTGADFKALLYNAQLEAINEFTSATDDGGESETPRFGVKSKTGLSNRLKSKSSKLKVDVKKRERHRSFASGTVAYVPNLTEGIIQMSAEMEERLNTQISQIRLRERRASDHFVVDNQPDSPFQMKNLLIVTQKHLLSAVSKMRPSVSGDERQKYQRIYENFVSSRGGHFDTGFMEANNMKLKATLA